MGEKRWRILQVTPELLVELAKNGAHTIGCSSDVPADARFHHAFYSETSCMFCVVIEHESFSPVTEGALIPYVDLAWIQRKDSNP